MDASYDFYFGLRHHCYYIIGGFYCHHTRYVLLNSPQHSWGFKYFNYKQLSAKYETEQITLESRIEELEKTITLRKSAAEDVDTFVNLIKEYSLITKLDAATLHRLIDKIEVYSAEMIDGEKSQKIEIYYKFVGRI